MKMKRTLTKIIAATMLGCAGAHADLVDVTADVASGTTNTWYATNTYVLNTVVYVQSNAVLNIEPGTVIKGKTNVTIGKLGIPNLVSALWVTRGGKLYANGTATNPIIFTAEGDDVNNPTDMPYNAMGLWGGVVLLGHGQLNSIDPASPRFGTPAPFVDQYEGTDNAGPNGEHLYGGTNDWDNSGSLSYVSIRYPGNIFATGRELNGLGMGAVGAGTTIEHIEVLNSQDDGFEFWGGMVNTKYLIAAFCDDDDFDTDAGYRGTNQFWFGIKPTWTGSGDSRGFETDGDYNQAVFNEAPIARWYAYNVTLIGRGTNETLAARKTAWSPRDEPAPNVINSIFTEWNSGLRMEGDALYHFTNTPTLGNAMNNIWNVINTLDSATSPRGDFLFSDASRSNSIANPLLGGISYTNNGALNPRPQAGSPAFINVLPGAPVAVSYRGAFSGPSDNWADGWTALSSMSFLAEAVPAPGTPPVIGTALNGSNLDIVFATQLGFSYQLQSTTNLGAMPINWSPEGSPILGTGNSLTSSVPTTASEKFFRVQVQ
jgi:hypothetical protein